jgi:hypothetical protein
MLPTILIQAIPVCYSKYSDNKHSQTHHSIYICIYIYILHNTSFILRLCQYTTRFGSAETKHVVYWHNLRTNHEVCKIYIYCGVSDCVYHHCIVVTYTYKKSTAFHTLIFTKFTNAKQNYVVFFCTEFHKKIVQIMWLAGTDIYLRPYPKYGLHCVDIRETHNHSVHICGKHLKESLYKPEEECRK